MVTHKRIKWKCEDWGNSLFFVHVTLHGESSEWQEQRQSLDSLSGNHNAHPYEYIHNAAWKKFYL